MSKSAKRLTSLMRSSDEMLDPIRAARTAAYEKIVSVAVLVVRGHPRVFISISGIGVDASVGR
jgi:hypothetical protein